MERRILLAVTLSFAVLFIYQNFLVEQPPDAPPALESGSRPSNPGLPADVGGAERAAQPPSAAPAPPPDVGPAPLVSAAARDIVVETPDVRAVFSSRGAELRAWQLKRYGTETGQPLDLVPSGLPETEARPFALRVEDEATTRILRTALFKPSADRLQVDGGESVLSFEYRDASGLTAVKEFRFDAARPYVIRFTATVRRGDELLNPIVEWGPGLGDAPVEASQYFQASQGILSSAGKVTRIAASSLAEQPVHEGQFDFAGVDDHYFIAATLPRGANTRIRYEAVTLPSGAGTSRTLVKHGVQFAAPPAGATFFFGPKDFDVLAATDREFVRAIHFGWFAFLVVPLLRSLKWINAFIGNYGWSIIILTILINLAMFPLRHKSVVSMRRMQELQPEVKAIQDRYAKLKTTDPARQKMNVELMNLYRERGVNPASGCLPMLLTMPVLFAFYSLLSVAIEIRGAPFVMWIHDLSAHDPLYVTPVLMGLTMVWQQMITPTTADPMQQKIMMFMPIMFTFMFLWAPSGLVLYWLVSNLWGIGQQQITNRIIGPPAVKAVRPPAERRLKRVGGGKSEQASENA
jgi:YidC/Oxa1 family membrane protein insertase